MSTLLPIPFDPKIHSNLPRKTRRLIKAGSCFANDEYIVVRRVISDLHSGGSNLVHLSIRRRDGAKLRSWSDLQTIKNNLVGPENEGIELFPAESRKVDLADHYHLWVIADKAFRFPLGFT